RPRQNDRRDHGTNPVTKTGALNGRRLGHWRHLCKGRASRTEGWIVLSGPRSIFPRDCTKRVVQSPATSCFCTASSWEVRELGYVSGVYEMSPGWRRSHERTATLAFDGRAASARLDASQKDSEQKQPDKGTATSLPLRFLYWIYERRLLHQLKQGA